MSTIQSAPLRDAKGGLLLVPSARPPLIRLQKRHSSGTRSPNRVRARCQLAPSASSAVRSWSLPLSSTDAGSKRTASATKAVTITRALIRKRRRQSRAVVIGTPSRSAIGRMPRPLAMLSASAWRIT
jgi:hypothetical protein